MRAIGGAVVDIASGGFDWKPVVGEGAIGGGGVGKLVDAPGRTGGRAREEGKLGSEGRRRMEGGRGGAGWVLVGGPGEDGRLRDGLAR